MPSGPICRRDRPSGSVGRMRSKCTRMQLNVCGVRMHQNASVRNARRMWVNVTQCGELCSRPHLCAFKYIQVCVHSCAFEYIIIIIIIIASNVWKCTNAQECIQHECTRMHKNVNKECAVNAVRRKCTWMQLNAGMHSNAVVDECTYNVTKCAWMY